MASIHSFGIYRVLGVRRSGASPLQYLSADSERAILCTRAGGDLQHRRGVMKVIVADKISDRGEELLKKSGLNTGLTTTDTSAADLTGPACATVQRQRR